MRSFPTAALAWIALLPLVAQAPTGYQKPSKEVLEVLHAPQEPRVFLSPGAGYLVMGEPSRYPRIAELAEPMLRLAGIRINPRSNTPHGAGYVKSLRLRALQEPKETPIALPEMARIGGLRWNASGSLVALTNTTPDGMELWVLDPKTAQARAIPGVRLNPLLGFSIQWLADNATLLVKLLPEGRGAAPAAPDVPPGPKVMDTLGTKAASSTYEARDLLKTPHDADLFDYFTRSQLALIHVPTGKVTRLGQPAVYTRVEASPDGQHLLVERLARPYSFLRPYGRFPREVEVWSPERKVEERLASLPLADRVPNRGVEVGPRNFTWRSTAPATLVWFEALDQGDPKVKVPERDRVMLRPLGGQPLELFRTPERCGGLQWLEQGDQVLVSDYDPEKHWTRSWLHRVGDPQAKARLLWNRSTDDGYKDPGYPLYRLQPNNQWAVRQEGDYIYTRGQGASPDGDRPFLDRINLKTLEAERLFRCDKEHAEQVLDWVDLAKGTFLTYRESPTEYPNVHLRTLERKALKGVPVGEARFASALKPVTAFPDPFPMLKGISKQRITAQRPDGVAVNVTLYLPANHKAGTRLPCVFWAYPLDFTEAANASQVEGSTKTFTYVAGTSNLFFLLAGYAVMEVAMPVVGPVEGAYDTFIEQLEANAKAAIDKVDALGVIDRERIGVGGHSHGALMTATFMAHSQLFRAGIARSGAYNHTLRPFGFQNEKRTLYDAKDTYIKLSPLVQADKIKKPILLIHGEIDSNPGTVPMQTEKLFEALRGLGATARLVMLPYEDHGYRAMESTEHVLYEMINWFDTHVKQAPPKGK